MKLPLLNKKVLITAGPTREAIDPVRYISNHSSGKMGYAIAERFITAGAEVYLVSGPVSTHINPHSRLRIVQVISAADMYLACCQFFETVDIAIFSAAVADYRPEKISPRKIKKEEDSFTIKMVKNIDIAYEFGKIKTTDQLSIGFALETNDEVTNAMHKLARKNFDIVILNSLNEANAAFGVDTNKITILQKDLTQVDFPTQSKKQVAENILSVTCNLYNEMKRMVAELV